MTSKKVIDKPEFREAVEHIVSDSVKKAIQEALAGVTANAALKTVATGAPSDDLTFARALAVSLAEMAQQGTGKGKPVAPEVLAARERAREEMFDLIHEIHAAGETPAYRLRHMQYLDERRVEPYHRASDKTVRPTEIEWPGVPNHGMIPINDPAKRIYDAFERSVGSLVKINGKFATDPDKLRVTAKGLVVVGDPSPARHDAPVIGGDVGNGGLEGLRVRGRGDDRNTAVRVLGTVAAPALQN